MSLQSELTADFRSMLAESGVNVVIGSQAVDALVSEPQVGAQIDIGGLVPEAQLLVRVLKADLTISPTLGQLVNVDGEDYRITTIRRRPSSPFITLDLASPHE